VTKPVVMMFSIPLAAAGSFWALILTGNSLFNANTLTGFLILLGVVVNNGIILMDYSRILQKRGYGRSRALLMAGQARIRPILITAITTIVAMFPLAMGRAEYVTSVGAPFAITVIGGLLISTLLTLIFIPTLNSGLESALAWLRKLHWKVKTGQAAAFLILTWLIYSNVDGLLWRSVYFIGALLVVPGFTYFIMTSLRKARSRVIKPEEEIKIVIRNLVKIYDRDSRFAREWKKGRKIQEHAGLTRSRWNPRDLESLVWQLPLLGFLVYFVYFYMTNDFWMFVLSHLVYFFGFTVTKPLFSFLENRGEVTRKGVFLRIRKILSTLYFWGFPFLNMVIFSILWRDIASVLFIGLIWYIALVVYTTSNRLHRENVNIFRLKGRFAGLRRRFYQGVQLIPVIGRRKRPFRALNQVSLQIGRGMFGLLGPNGAGKTTLMRIICGVFQQSYGKIWINGLDTLEYREELQGLIGYLPQEFGTYENMTACEFLDYQAILKGLTDPAARSRRVGEVLAAVHMDEHGDEKIGSFSGGMKQRIGIAQTLLHLPRILVVDEPTAGLDPRERIRFRNLLVELSRERIVIFSTHVIEDISSSCNQVAVLNRGSLCYLGAPPEMARSAEGRVWQFHVPAMEFDTVTRGLQIVHHMRDGDQIRVRCISESIPVPQAKPVRPTLEDAYLWLLRERA
jgi:ABC-type multidrug transport system ATPase subunit